MMIIVQFTLDIRSESRCSHFSPKSRCLRLTITWNEICSLHYIIIPICIWIWDFERPGHSARLLIAKLHNNWEIRQKQKQSSIAVSCRERTFPFLTTYEVLKTESAETRKQNNKVTTVRVTWEVRVPRCAPWRWRGSHRASTGPGSTASWLSGGCRLRPGGESSL